MDCISAGESPSICVSAMASGGTYATLLPLGQETVSAINPNVKWISTIAYTVMGEPLTYGTTVFPVKPEDFEFGKTFMELSEQLLAEGKVKVHRPAVDKYGKGLAGILKGLEEMRAGNVSGEKLVVTL